MASIEGAASGSQGDYAQTTRFGALDQLQRIAIVLAAGSVAIRLILIWGVLRNIDVHTENMRVGFTLAETGQFANPFILPTGPTAHIAPLYPGLIAVASWASGSTAMGFLIARSVLAVMFGIFIAALPRIATILGFGPRTGLLTALTFFVPMAPVFTYIELTGQHETVLTSLLFVAMATGTIGTFRSGNLRLREAALLGAGWGLSLHTSPVLLPALLGLLLAAFWFFRLPFRGLLPFCTVLLVALGLTVLPWTVRNYRTLGTTSLIRDNFGLELQMSNADDAGPDMNANISSGGSMTRHPFFSEEAAREMARIGEREYYEQASATATQWIAANPGRFAELTVRRIGLFFIPRLGFKYHPWFFLPLVPLAFLGLVYFARERMPEAMALLFSLLAYAAPYFIVQSSPRYGYPVLWILTLFASWFVLEGRKRLRTRVRLPESGST